MFLLRKGCLYKAHFWQVRYFDTRRKIINRRCFHVAIVGSGPSGYYATKELSKTNIRNLKFDMFERWPTPYGLVRSGVAPDHPEVKVVENLFEKISIQPNFTFFGNVHVGRAISTEKIHDIYPAVIYCCGAEDERKLNIPGEHLVGVYSARTFVEWYNGHFSRGSEAFNLSGERVVIIGNGNVALDLARILYKNPQELAHTDISSSALEVISKNRVHQIHLVGRRGPVQAAFTTGELRHLLRMKHVEIRHEFHGSLSPSDEIELKARPKKRKFELLMSSNRSILNSRKIIFSFFKKPVEFVEDPTRPGRLKGVKFEITTLSGEAENQQAVGTGNFIYMPTDIAFRSIGYQCVPLENLPFDQKNRCVLNERGKVSPGIYVCGWLKRGATGVIETNILDAQQAIGELKMDLEAGLISEDVTVSGLKTPADSTKEIEAILKKKGIRSVSFEDWKKIDAAEIERGRSYGKPREKFQSVCEALQILKSSPPS